MGRCFQATGLLLKVDVEVCFFLFWTWQKRHGWPTFPLWHARLRGAGGFLISLSWIPLVCGYISCANGSSSWCKRLSFSPSPSLTAAAALARPDVTEGRWKEGGRKKGREKGREGERDGGRLRYQFRYRRNSQIVKFPYKIIRRRRFHIVCWINSTSDSCPLSCQLAAKCGRELCILSRHRVIRLCLV